MRLQDQVAVITGAETGIGRAIAVRLAQEGAAVAVNYFDARDAAEAVVAQIRDGGGKALPVEADVSDDPYVRNMIGQVLGEWGRVDVLVNNAAITPSVDPADLEGLTEEMWDRIFAVNLKGVFFCSRAVAPVMKRQKQGRIVNIASVAGLTGRGSSLAFGASQAGVLSLTRSLAIVLAPEVRVNAIAPGHVASAAGDGGQAPSLLGRGATAEDIAEVVATFAADASYVTGQILRVDGGATL
jgi:3-oxoacyl-[acyl-carrier protein] reductase